MNIFGRGNKEAVIMLLCAGAAFLSGCGAQGTEGSAPLQIEEQVQDIEAPAEMTDAPADGSGKEGALDDTDAGKESAGVETEEDSDEKGEAFCRAEVRHYYGGILSQIVAARQLPDGELDTSSLDAGFGKMEDNHFAVTDIDGDGREELIISYANAIMAGMFSTIYDYDPELGELKRELTEFPALTFYDNGVIKAEASHNHSRGDFWPFALYQYDAESDMYNKIAYVTTWSKELSPQWYEGQPFPDDLDTDGDGVLFHIQEGGTDSFEFEDYKYNQADYEAWYASIMEGAGEIQIDYQPMDYEAFADFTPDYLKLLADEAGKGRSDTAADLGLLVFGEEHFLDASKKLLGEKYGVEITQPDADFEEYTVGTLHDREIFSFEHLNAGVLGYQGEQVGDVTVFGIYPGISVDQAWEKLQSYGFYASPYGEVENCLITGLGFDNISVWFSQEDGKVTQISLHPYCAFAG